MRNVQGRLRIDLAQFRSLQAFAQFASDLDPTTKAQIDRGQRLQEVLKQPQYSPMPLEDQVIIIYAATNGYLDDVDVNKIDQWRADVLNFMHTAHADLCKSIYEDRLNKKFPTPEIKNGLDNAIKEFKQTSDYSNE
jgi:F-type H+-transporting ATPase subunit alpha